MKTTSRYFRPTAVSALCVFLPALASAQEACTTYTVQDGDTLSSIAETAYGSYDYQMIFNANRETLTANPRELPVGMQLILPCEDGRLSPDAELATVIETETEKQAATAKSGGSFEPPVKFVSANGWLPFADESLTGGGMMNRLALTALQRGGNDREATIAWVDDWGSHLDILLPTGAMDVSVAWMMPDCSKSELLGDFSMKRCNGFDKSLPVYEMAFSFVSLADNKYANVPNFNDLAGARICRPNEYELEMLETEGLVEPFITMVQPTNPIDCAKAIIDGEADVYVDGTETAVSLLGDLGAADKISVNPNLVKFQTVHFLVAKNNPRGRIYLAMINRGITEMRESGEWYDIVATSLAEYSKLGQ